MQPHGLTIERIHSNGCYELKLEGELDLAAVSDVKAEIRHAEVALERSEGIEEVVIDTSNVSFIDSSGIGALVAARKQLGKNLTLIPGPPTRRLLRLTDTIEFFDLS